ncbi:uncharacterized protein LOC126703829 [Quercus robur]|uniref:uncharacterized protein LOC126703829 n=1 Tax=Quercus robur TaxID=38942 RepID=UPI0021621DED|nr:uncharacterized protein LOC126703829 [Quercus robur]
MKVHTYEDGDLVAEHGLATGLPYFERIYICLEGCKKGFLAGCMPIIGLDACHLKTKTGGQLMCAVGRDPNDEYFPFAYAVVEAETKDSWTWFLNLLLADIGDDKQWVFIFDQQKGLVNTFVDNWPQYEHRICCRHLYQNLRKNHPGVIIRDIFWKAAKATYRQAFERAMNELKEVDEDAFKWLQSQSTTIWARHMFKSDGQSDTVLNNMCESFNSTIVKFRSKLIITMLECIRLYLMTRFQANREMIMKVESELCPKIRKRLYKEKLACSKWIACWVGRMKFEVKNGLESFIVDLKEKKCSCRKWDIVGIPCCHAISCIFFNREDAEKYVNACYKRTTYIDCYEPIIEPINGQNMWGPSGLPPVQPPIKRRPLGMPRKKRALEPDEPRSHRKKKRPRHLKTMQVMWEIRTQQEELQGRSRRELLLAWECIPSQQLRMLSQQYTGHNQALMMIFAGQFGDYADLCQIVVSNCCVKLLCQIAVSIQNCSVKLTVDAQLISQTALAQTLNNNVIN